MAKTLKLQWLFFAAIAMFWILIIQIIPRFLPFKFDRVVVWGVVVHTDYLTHILLFVAIVLLVNAIQITIRAKYILPTLIAVAAIAEFVQVYIPRRTFNWWDLASNVAGVFIGFMLIGQLKRIRNA
ncbi:MAG: VanZ family protein [Bacteroidales bacterium]